MDVTQPTNDAQTLHWNTTAGRAWVDTQDLLDQMMKGLENLLVDSVTAGPGRRVLDVGCGTGGTTLAVARRLGTGGPGSTHRRRWRSFRNRCSAPRAPAHGGSEL
jgi:ubiquinone/menaquinone biosynthesis C-methylase UbiE